MKILVKNMERKQQIRAELKQKRDLLTKEQVTEASQRICEKLLCYIQKEQPEVVYFYYPLGKEVNLLPLAEELLKEGRKIAFPRTSGETMEFYPVTSLTDFVEGNFHIMEPKGKVPLAEEEPLILVPGLGFDRKGNRMGYGKGFYDRYFARFPSCRKIGASYWSQIVEELPCGEYDVAMDEVVTELAEGRKDHV